MNIEQLTSKIALLENLKKTVTKKEEAKEDIDINNAEHPIRAVSIDIIDMVEQRIRETHPMVEKIATELKNKDGENPNTLLYGAVYYDLENDIMQSITEATEKTPQTPKMMIDVFLTVFKYMQKNMENKRTSWLDAKTSFEDALLYTIENLTEIDEFPNFNAPKCPLGGDTINDCEGCIYSEDYHFNKETGDCEVRPLLANTRKL